MADQSQVYEKLGLFYLGKRYDLTSRELSDELVLYDSKDLVTHAVCVGMTGSGKTGLGITLLEEAAIDGIPALVIDPKGDLTNLLLNFPNLSAEELLPWIHSADAQRDDLTPEQLAQKKAELWKKGLHDWGQPTERIRTLGDACDYTIFTPGSESGVPVSIMSSFAAPPASVLEDSDMMRDRIATTATSLLSLLGIDADPIRSREHILLTTILDHCWRKKMDLDLGRLIRMLQDPPVQRVGVMDLESFYPSKDRFELAMSLNNLLAAPGFASWMTGEPLDVDRLLYTDDGRPRVSIFYTAHLSDSERLFFTALLLNQTLGWMRGRPGTTSLRAVLYIDEIFGYMPPVAEPPTKKPLLTLLKQARAYGLGVVLATQNPVDLDYKGLSNTGTWFLGRLQTERDKDRVLDGLQGASAEAGGRFDRAEMSGILSGVGKRVFLMHNVHEEEPVVFHTRWALSYLAGPLTRQQIKTLMEHKNEARQDDQVVRESANTDRQVPEQPAAAGDEAGLVRPVLPPEISQLFVPIASGAHKVLYQPHLMGIVRMHYVDTRKSLSADENLLLLTPLSDSAFGVDWSAASEGTWEVDELETEAPSAGSYAELPASASQSKSYRKWEKALSDHVYRTRRYRLYTCKELKEVSHPGEDERDFRIRLAERAREERDERCEKLRAKYASKIASLEDRVRRAAQKVEREKQEASGAKMQSMISLGSTILSAVLGRKRLSSTTVSRASSAARGANRAARQAEDVQRAEDNLEAYQERLGDLESELEDELREIEQRLDVFALQIDELWLKPRRQDVDVRKVALAWVGE